MCSAVFNHKNRRLLIKIKNPTDFRLVTNRKPMLS
nr:MAG TPA: hypothetical protein [Bacteriophage sp.]